METWDEDYFNEEVQAFIEFEENEPALPDVLNPRLVQRKRATG